MVCATIWMNLKGTVLTISKDYILRDFICISKSQNYTDGEQISGCQGMDRRRVGKREKCVHKYKRGSTQEFLYDVGIALYLYCDGNYKNLYMG